jgi:hypothetical protein
MTTLLILKVKEFLLQFVCFIVIFIFVCSGERLCSVPVRARHPGRQEDNKPGTRGSQNHLLAYKEQDALPAFRTDRKC